MSKCIICGASPCKCGNDGARLPPVPPPPKPPSGPGGTDWASEHYKEKLKRELEKKEKK